MIRELNNLKGFSLDAADGRIGKVKNAYFDDSEWVVRYLVVDTGGWLSGRNVLISPLFIEGVDWEAGAVRVTLTRQQVEDSPDMDFDKPVSRQQEAQYYNQLRSFAYWTGPFVWGRFPYPGAAQARDDVTRDDAADLDARLQERVHRGDRNVEDAHLRSANEVNGYQIEARDGSLGHVEDLLFDDETWLIESIIVDTRNWLPGRQVMVPPDWIENVNWLGRTAQVSANREKIRQRPEYPDELLTQERHARSRSHVASDHSRRHR